MPPSPNLHVGDLVYLSADRDKSSARDRYLIVSVDGQWSNIQKFRGSQIHNTSYREISTPRQETLTPPTAQPEAEQEVTLELEEQGVHELSEQGTSCQTDFPLIHPSLQDEASDYNEQPLRRPSRSRCHPDRLNDMSYRN
ncbi:Retrovirus-related Pol poly from transposon opus [Paramuricea clavata]|uniref:Retrovirus-related Pol poly from transposon opus n=1 Tax=Paramuricea clavata TaxID=317549 RepID=A0A7D9M1K7_PARCT|nr:Retrovirus-related Pol poly from transposon opus [Paramuricea clavata]